MPGIITSFGVLDSWADTSTAKTPLFCNTQQNASIKKVSPLDHVGQALEIRQYIVDDDLNTSQNITKGIYQPRLGSDQFRLLEILPGISNVIEARLRVCNISKNAMAYEALSYTWGSGEVTQHAKIRVEANQEHHMIGISRNLHSALLGLRRTDSSRVIWADAICINQKNVREKSQQVQMMRTIYGNAYRVIVWLGDESDDDHCYQPMLGDPPPTSRSLDSVCSIVNDWLLQNNEKDVEATYTEEVLNNSSSIITHHNKGKCNFNTQNWDYRREYRRRHSSLLNLFERQWFSRIWVIQEAVLARSAIVQLGRYQIEWEWIGLAASIILHNPIVDPNGAGKIVPSGVANAYLMYRLSASQSCFPPLKFTFVELLRATRSFQCKEERDKIYGLTGIQTTDGINEKIIPDYSKEVKLDKVYQDTAWLLLRGESPLTLLSSAMVSNRGGDCHPGSWIPNWGQRQPWTILPVQPHPRFQCATNHPSGIIGNNQTAKLIVEGVIVHRIKAVWDTDVHCYEQERKAQDFLRKPRWSESDWQKCALSLSCGGDGRGYPVNNASTHLADLAAAVLSLHREWLIYNLLAFETVIESRLDDMTQFDFLADIAKDGNASRFINAMAPLRRNYKAFVTELSIFGVGPVSMKEGDVLCVLFGAAVPFVLRPVQGGYHLVGECYAFDLMHGEIFTMITSASSGSLKSSYITLV
ncbi:hypothetical protein HYE68_003944 [Fusarium pseudograminearum]|nr:hypothetical protein HYE68_003944 [Fusarium pseudograminearum]